jgi:hypothetical protein
MDLTKSIIGSGEFRAKRVSSRSPDVCIPLGNIIIETACSDKHIIFYSKSLVELFDQQKKLRIMKDKIATTIKVNGHYPLSEIVANDAGIMKNSTLYPQRRTVMLIYKTFVTVSILIM